MIQSYKPKVSEYKKKEVDEIVNLFNKYPVVGLVNLENLPAFQLHKMRKQLRDKMIFKMTRKRFIQIALDEVKKPGVEKLKENIQGMPALIFTNENPFKFYKLIDKNKSPAPAKSGQISPVDIIIPAGPTQFTPGPMIGELGQLGIKTEVKEGKISVREDRLLVKKGDVINQKTADLLPKFGIEPMEIGLNLLLTYENGEIIYKDILSISDDYYLSEIKRAFSESLGLALYLGYPTKETIKLLVQKAYREAKALEKRGSFEANKEIKDESGGHPHIGKREEPKKVITQPILKEEIQRERAPREAGDIGFEIKKPIEKDDVQKAQDVIKMLQERAVESLKNKQEEKKKEQFKSQEENINKIINNLKDKKARGEI